jgi:hypothetical protein
VDEALYFENSQKPDVNCLGFSGSPGEAVDIENGRDLANFGETPLREHLTSILFLIRCYRICTIDLELLLVCLSKFFVASSDPKPREMGG